MKPTTIQLETGYFKTTYPDGREVCASFPLDMKAVNKALRSAELAINARLRSKGKYQFYGVAL